jgi:hypothetical protein
MVYAWYIRSTPKDFSQVLAVCDVYYDNAFPFVYVLLENKSEETYTTVLHQMNEKQRTKTDLA